MEKRFKKFLHRQLAVESWGGSYLEYWLNPKGQIIRAPQGHLPWARQSGVLQIPELMWEDRQYVYQCMAKKGFVKVTDMGPEIFYQKYVSALDQKFVVHLSRTQHQALIDFGVAKQKPVIGVGFTEPSETLYEPPKNDAFAENVVVGVSEPAEIDGIGSVLAKIDSGNDGYNVIHGINTSRSKNEKGEVIVKFQTIDDKTVSFKQIGWVEVVAGGINHQRPVIALNVRVKGKFFSNEPFSVADRSQNDEKVLFGVPFIQKMDAVIDVNKAKLVPEGWSQEHDERVRLKNEEIDKHILQLKRELQIIEKEIEHHIEVMPSAVPQELHKEHSRLTAEIEKLENSKLVTAAMTADAFRKMREQIKNL